MTELFISLIVFLFIADIAVYYFFIKRKVNLLNKEREEFEQEEEESINEFVQKYKELDEELAQRVEEIQALNTVVLIVLVIIIQSRFLLIYPRKKIHLFALNVK